MPSTIGADPADAQAAAAKITHAAGAPAPVHLARLTNTHLSFADRDGLGVPSCLCSPRVSTTPGRIQKDGQGREIPGPIARKCAMGLEDSRSIEGY
jgi:hypothetical protein